MQDAIRAELERNRQAIARAKQRAEQLRQQEASSLYQAAKWAREPVDLLFRSWRQLRFGVRRERLLKEYFAQPGFKGLHVGAGGHYLDGWLNTDVLPSRLPLRIPEPKDLGIDFPLDIRHELPFEDSTLDVIYAEEVIEHVERHHAFAFLREARRVLKPGGTLRMTTPDLEKVCEIYLGQVENVSLEEFEPYWLEAEFSNEVWINGMFHFWGHRFLWNYAALEEALLDAGFSTVTRCNHHESPSGVPELETLDMRFTSETPTPALTVAVTLLLEATK